MSISRECETNESFIEGRKEWKREIKIGKKSEYSIDFPIPKPIFPKKCNPYIFQKFQEGNITKNKELFHGSPEKFDVLKPTHDYYGQRAYSAISSTTEKIYAIAFAIIKLTSDKNQIYIYKFSTEAAVSEHQIGIRIKRTEINNANAFDVLFDVRDFLVNLYKIDISGNFKEDQKVLFDTLKGEINELNLPKIIETINKRVIGSY